MSRSQLFFGLVVLLSLVGLRLMDPKPAEALRHEYFDMLQRISPRENVPVGVRVVDIDEESLAAVGQWPWPRDILADIVLKLKDLGAVVVVFDILFAEADRYSPSQLVERGVVSSIGLPDGIKNRLKSIDFDQQLAESFEQIPVVVGTARRIGSDVKNPTAIADVLEYSAGLIDALPPMGPATPVVPALLSAAAGIGNVNVDPFSEASTIRTVPMVWYTEAGPMPSLALEALRIAFGEETIILWGDDAAAGVIQAVGVGPIDIPTRRDGQIWVRYRVDTPELYVSAQDVLSKRPNDAELRDKFNGHIVFVGTSAAGLFDIRKTALGQSVPGVSIHAQIVEQALQGAFLTRADWVKGVEVLSLLLLGLLIGYRMFRSGPAMSFATGAVGAVVISAGSWFAFSSYNILIDASFPLVGGFVGFTIIAGYQFIVMDRHKRQMRQSFSRYVAPAVLDQIESNGFSLELGGEIRPATVMFCDIRDFTQISERYNAVELVSFLNALFDRLSAQILKSHGTIDKFIGDSIMAFWNAPLYHKNHPDEAIEAALGMRQALQKFNEERDDPPVRLAIGISTGDVCVGNIGSEDRFDYSVIGANVNTAARLEAACRYVGCEVLISDATRIFPKRFACLYAGALQLKGISKATPAWVLLGDAAMAESKSFQVLEIAFESWQRAVQNKAPESERDAHLRDCFDGARTCALPIADFLEALSGRAEDYVVESV